jgi:hypothetical protein
MMKKKDNRGGPRPNSGGARSGAGRPATDDPRVALTFSIRRSKKEKARELLQPVVDRINKKQ